MAKTVKGERRTAAPKKPLKSVKAAKYVYFFGLGKA